MSQGQWTGGDPARKPSTSNYPRYRCQVSFMSQGQWTGGDPTKWTVYVRRKGSLMTGVPSSYDAFVAASAAKYGQVGISYGSGPSTDPVGNDISAYGRNALCTPGQQFETLGTAVGDATSSGGVGFSAATLATLNAAYATAFAAARQAAFARCVAGGGGTCALSTVAFDATCLVKDATGDCLRADALGNLGKCVSPTVPSGCAGSGDAACIKRAFVRVMNTELCPLVLGVPLCSRVCFIGIMKGPQAPDLAVTVQVFDSGGISLSEVLFADPVLTLSNVTIAGGDAHVRVEGVSMDTLTVRLNLARVFILATAQLRFADIKVGA